MFTYSLTLSALYLLDPLLQHLPHQGIGAGNPALQITRREDKGGPFLVEPDGRKLAKRRGSPSLADMRRAGEDGLALAEALRRGKLPTGISLAEGVNSTP